MASSKGRDASPSGISAVQTEEDSILGTALSTKNIEAFGRKVTTTANHLMGPFGDAATGAPYQSALTELHKELRRPAIQRRVFSFAQASPSEIVRSKLSTSEIQYRALSFVPDELLANIPEDDNVYSLFQGFQATLPEIEQRKGSRRRSSRGQRLLGAVDDASEIEELPSIGKLKRGKRELSHRLEMLGIRKNMASSEIREIDNKIANLNTMRKIVLDRLAALEHDEALMEHDILNVDHQLEDLQEELDDAAALSLPTPKTDVVDDTDLSESNAANASFMSESIYEKLPSPKTRKHKTISAFPMTSSVLFLHSSICNPSIFERTYIIKGGPNKDVDKGRQSMPILHEHFEPGLNIRDLQAHNDMITALDFDVPFGTMVTAALDDTVRVWDLNAGRCMGLLEGHHADAIANTPKASVRCVQVEDNIVATGSMDASIRLWDLSRAQYFPQGNRINKDDEDDEDDGLAIENPDDLPPPPPASSMQDCPLFSLEAHVGEVTALYLRGDTLVSGSADKTLRQWDLEKGRCVQTLDVLWAAAQASATMGSGDGQWRQTGRLPDASADFVGALQCFDAALACGTADGMVRLWDLRSGQVHRSLVGHTGPVTCLQFDDVHMVTGSMDRSIRIWDLRTGSIYDAFAYDNPITSMQFDSRRIVAAAGEDVVKVYDKTDGRHWDCGAGVNAEEENGNPAIIERVRIKDGYLTEGRKDGVVGVWAC